MSDPAWLDLKRALVDTGVFIYWHRGDSLARFLFRHAALEIYYSRITRKELLHPLISDAERQKLLRLLATVRLVNPDEKIAASYTELLLRYAYLQDHLADALIAATAWAKKLPLITTNPRHFVPIQELEVFTFHPTEEVK